MIVVTGASGHLGQWVIAELTRRGHDVLAVSRNPRTSPTIAGLTWAPRVRALSCDLAVSGGLDPLRAELADVTGVVHLGAMVPSDTAKNTDDDADATLATNAYGTARLLGLLAGAPRLQAFVYASTFEVYGSVVSQPIDEDHATAPTNYYGATKLAGEQYARLFGSDRKVAVSSLRLPAIYGPGDTIRRAIGNFVRAAADGTPIQIQGDGADLRELIFAADAADAVAISFEQKANGPFNIASGRGISIREMAETVQRVAGTHVEVAYSERVKPRADYVLSIERAKLVLGWSPNTSLEDGIRAQLAWVRSLRT